MRNIAIIADQGIVSATTILVTLTSASRLPAEAFGQFALFSVTAVTLVGFCRAALFEPILVITGSESSIVEPARVILKSARNWAALVGASLAVILLLAGVFLGINPAYAAIAFGLFLQDAVRMSFLVLGRPVTVAGSSAGALVLQVLILSLVLNAGISSVEIFILAWGGAGLMAALPGILYLLLLLRGASSERTQVDDIGGSLGRAYGAEYLLGILTTQFTLWFAYAVLGPVATGALRAAETLVSPFRLLIGAMPNLLLGSFSGLRASRPWEVLRQPLIVLTTIWMLYSICILLIPDEVGELLLGETWQVSRQILPAYALALGPVIGTTLLALWMKAIGAQSHLLRARICLIPVSVFVTAISTVLWGLPGAAYALAAVSLIAVGLWTAAYLSARRKLDERH